MGCGVAKCDEGYLCDVCGEEVERLTESELYLRFVAGWVDAETLHTTAERHILCNPTIAQFIVSDHFPHVEIDGPFDKRQLDPAYVKERERLLTAAWLRLRDIEGSEGDSLLDYPLEEVLTRLREG
jgi:hypothetical protein